VCASQEKTSQYVSAKHFQLIWAFKDARDNAFEKVAQMTAAHLIKVCGEKIKDIVFVCVPASTQAKNESRYMAFCNRVSDLCKPKNESEI
jgi:hypothetical protein